MDLKQRKNNQKLQKVPNKELKSKEETKRECKSRTDEESLKYEYSSVDPNNQEPSSFIRRLNLILDFIFSNWKKCAAILFGLALLFISFNLLKKDDDAPKIINEVHLKEFPSLVGIVYGDSTMKVFGCTGTFIYENLISTAAHCLKDESILEIYYWDHSKNNITIIPASEFTMVIHKDFDVNDPAKGNDIGIIKLKESVSIKFAFLPTNEQILPEQLTMAVFKQNKNVYETTILEREIKIMDEQKCSDIYREIYVNYYNRSDNLKLYKNVDDGSKDESIQISFCVDSENIYAPRGYSGSPVFTKNANNVFIEHGILSHAGSRSYSNLPYVYLKTGSYYNFFNEHD